MNSYKNILLFFIVYSIYSCGKHEENKHDKHSSSFEKNTPQKTIVNSELDKKNIVLNTKVDSIKAVKESILKKQNYKKKKGVVITDSIATQKTESTNQVKTINKNKTIPSFVFIKKILKECEIGVPMTQKDLEANYNIPEEAIGLVKSLTKISENEVDIKWKSTWLIEKVSDAKFKDGRMKMRFDNNKMYTSGGAIAIKYEKKTYSDLILIGRNAYIPSVKGYHWQIGKD